KISLDFQDADIGPIFRLLADISGYNFVIDPAVKGKVTMKLMNVPWDQALDIILQTFSLGKSTDGNIIWIAPTATFTKIAEDKKKTKDVEDAAEELTQEIVRINYATASDINTAITAGKLLSARGSITTDNRMNTLIIKDIQKSINKIKDLVKVMDISKPQVMIEAKIVQVSSDYNQTLGIRWGAQFVGPEDGTTFVSDVATNQIDDGNTPKGRSGIKGLGDDINSIVSVNTPLSAASGAGGVASFLIGSANSFRVALSLQALETLNKAKTLSNPKILTLDNESAVIQQGRTFFISTVSQAGTQTQQQTATLMLNVTPKITPDGYVQLTLNVTDNSLVSVEPPVVDTKSLTTKALVKNGETLVLGGIYTTSTTEGETGIPILSKIPVLGWLFKTKTQTGPNVKEMLVFITPTIVGKQ
ncbi:MAG: type IV pilus secretin PilQ, partial [Nitrospirota bacterium]